MNVPHTPISKHELNPPIEKVRTRKARAISTLGAIGMAFFSHGAAMAQEQGFNNFASRMAELSSADLTKMKAPATAERPQIKDAQWAARSRTKGLDNG